MHIEIKLTATSIHELREILAGLDNGGSATLTAHHRPLSSEVEKKSDKKETPDSEPRSSSEVEKTTKIDLEALRAIVSEKAKDGHKSAILGLLDEFGVATVPELKKKDRESFYKKVAAL